MDRFLRKCARRNPRAPLHGNRLRRRFECIQGVPRNCSQRQDLEELKTNIDELLDEGYESNLWDAVVESVIQQKDYRKMIKGV